MPMGLFSLKWRFTDPNYNVLPKDKLLRIVPLKEEVASKMYQHLMPFLKNFQLDNHQFRDIAELNDVHKSDLTQGWLLKKVSNKKEKIAVLWDKENCVLVDSEVFCKYWDDFCYEGSDDVAVSPLSGEWLMYYFHGDQFQFGYRK